MLDVPNHLTRLWLESQVPLTGVLGKAYLIDWSRTSSNILVDLVGARLMPLFGFDGVWLAVTLAMVLAPPLAAIFLSRALNGRANPWQILALSVAWGQSTVFGFISYTVAVALALGFCYLNLRLLKGRSFLLRWGVGAVELWVIYLAHPFGLALFLAFELAMLLGPDWAGIRSLSLNRFCRLALCPALMPVPLAFYILAHHENSPLGLYHFMYRGLPSHLVSLVSPFFGYNELVELPLLAIMACCIGVAIWHGLIRFHAGLLVSAGLLVLAALLIPDGIGDASWLTRRFPLMAALLFFIAIRADDKAGHRADGLLLICSLAIMAHAAWIASVWKEREQDYADLTQIARFIPADSKLMIVLQKAPVRRWAQPGEFMHGSFTRTHLPSVLVPLAHAYVPALFAIKGQQPLIISSDFSRLQSQIATIASADPVTRSWSFAPDAGLKDWECDFDQLVLLKQDVGLTAPLAINHAHRVATTGFADLLTIDRPATCSGRGEGPVRSAWTTPSAPNP